LWREFWGMRMVGWAGMAACSRGVPREHATRPREHATRPRAGASGTHPTASCWATFTKALQDTRQHAADSVTHPYRNVGGDLPAGYGGALARARRKIASNIGSVSRPVNVFC